MTVSCVEVEKVQLYTSRLVLDPTRCQVQQALSNPWDMHRLLCSGEGAGHRADGRPLFRVECKPGQKPAVLVQTTSEVRWDALVQGQVAESYMTKSFAPTDLPRGTVLNFRTVVVPVVNKVGSRQVTDSGRQEALAAVAGSVPADQALRIWSHHDLDGRVIGWEVELSEGRRSFVGRRSKRRKAPLKSLDDVPGWIGRVMLGAEVLTTTDVVGSRVSMTRHSLSEPSGTEIAVRSAGVTGVLRIKDPAMFASTLAHGVGTCRAFGFGLVSIARRPS